MPEPSLDDQGVNLSRCRWTSSLIQHNDSRGSLTIATAGSPFGQGVAPNSAVAAQDQAELSYGVHNRTGFLPAGLAAGAPWVVLPERPVQ